MILLTGLTSTHHCALSHCFYFHVISFLVNLIGLECFTPLSTIFQLYCASVLLVEETGVTSKKPRPVADTDKIYHIKLYRVHLGTSIRTH